MFSLKTSKTHLDDQSENLRVILMTINALTVGCMVKCIFTFVMLFNTYKIYCNICLNILNYFLSKEKVEKLKH